MDLLYSTGNYTGYLIITCNVKEYEKVFMYIYGWITLLYQQNILNQLYLNKVKKGKIRSQKPRDPCRFYHIRAQ